MYICIYRSLPTNHRLQLHHHRRPSLPLYGTKCLHTLTNSLYAAPAAAVDRRDRQTDEQRKGQTDGQKRAL